MALAVIPVLFAGVAPSHGQTEISTFAECEASGGTVRVLELESLPIQIQTRCTIDGEVFVQGRDKASSDNGEKTNQRNNDETRAETGTRIETQMEAREETLRERQRELRQIRAERRTALSVMVQTRIENFANGLFARLEAGADRLRNIASRIDSRIEKIEDAGVDMSTQVELLADAELQIDDAETQILEAEVALEAMLASDTPKEAFEDLKAELEEARNALREAKQALIDVVQSIRKELIEQTGSASLEAGVNAEAESEAENR